MKNKTINKIRSAVLQARESGVGRVRYPEHVKQKVMKLLRAGQNHRELVGQTGISLSTLFQWSREAEPFQRLTSETETIPLEVPAQYKIILQNGIIIECSSESSLKQVLEILK